MLDLLFIFVFWQLEEYKKIKKARFLKFWWSWKKQLKVMDIKYKSLT